ncbi:hypothetical protein FRC11_013580 [Ceratobasidium sp. 423]|nr:hypothetical protein FRC11_013580 [Ceratobasidium sp. 423]
MPPKTEPRTPPPRASSPIKQTSDDIVQRILRGGYHNATFEGISQYTAEGVSASGLASMNAIRLAFELCSKMTDAKQLVSALISEEFVRKAMGIATHWPNDLHLEVDPILRLPLFSNSIRALDNQHAVCTSRTFFNIVTALRFDEKSPGPRAAHLTRPPEVIGVMHIPLHRSTSGVRASWRSCRQAESIYLVFDSHPRPDHPNGAAVQVLPSHSTNVVADYLMDLFQVDQEIMNDPDLEWTVQFLGQLSYHLLAPAPARETVDEYAMNMRILEGDRKCTRAEDRLKAAEATTRKLQAEIAKLYLQYRKARDEIQGLKAQLNRRSPPPKEDQRATGWFPSANRGGESSESKGKGREVPSGWQAGLAPRAESMFSSWFGDGGGREEISKPTEEIWGNPVGSRVGTSISPSASSSGASEFEPSPSSRVPPQPGPNYASVSSGASGRSNTHRGNAETEDTEAIRSLEYAMRLQRQSDDDTIKISTRGSTSNSKSIPLKGPRTRSVRPVRPIRPIRPIRLIRPTRPPTSATASSRAGGSLNNPSAPAPTEDLNAIRSPEPAMRLQGQFDEPVKSSMGESLARSTEKPTFNCGICMETFMEEAIHCPGCGTPIEEYTGSCNCMRDFLL